MGGPWFRIPPPPSEAAKVLGSDVQQFSDFRWDPGRR